MIKKFNEFIKEGMMSRMWRELDGTERRAEERVHIDGVLHHAFKDNNGEYHPHGYSIYDGDPEKLRNLIIKLIEIRGKDCDLNDICVSGIRKFDFFSYTSKNFVGVFQDTDFQGDISGWDVSGAEEMRCMFANCKNFDCDISKWEVGDVSDMTCMFFNCENFNQNLSDWDVKNLEYSNLMFSNCKKFNCDLSRWEVESLEDMAKMFMDCPIEKNPPAWYKEDDD